MISASMDIIVYDQRFSTALIFNIFRCSYQVKILPKTMLSFYFEEKKRERCNYTFFFSSQGKSDVKDESSCTAQGLQHFSCVLCIKRDGVLAPQRAASNATSARCCRSSWKLRETWSRSTCRFLRPDKHTLTDEKNTACC